MLYKPMFINELSFYRCSRCIHLYRREKADHPDVMGSALKRIILRYYKAKSKMLGLYFRKNNLYQFVTDEEFEEARHELAESIIFYNAALIAYGERPINRCYYWEGANDGISYSQKVWPTY